MADPSKLEEFLEEFSGYVKSKFDDQGNRIDPPAPPPGPAPTPPRPDPGPPAPPAPKRPRWAWFPDPEG